MAKGPAPKLVRGQALMWKAVGTAKPDSLHTPQDLGSAGSYLYPSWPPGLFVQRPSLQNLCTQTMTAT